MTTTPQNWGGGVWAVIPLTTLKVDLAIIESLMPLLQDQERVDALEEMFVETHLRHNRHGHRA